MKARGYSFVVVLICVLTALFIWTQCGPEGEPSSGTDEDTLETEPTRKPRTETTSLSKRRLSTASPSTNATEPDDITDSDVPQAHEDEDSTKDKGSVTLAALPIESITAPLSDALPEIKECYNQALKEVPHLEGRIFVKFTIASEEEYGRVTKASIKDADFDDEPLENCILDAVEALEFDRPDGGGIVIVTYPFTFEPD